MIDLLGKELNKKTDTSTKCRVRLLVQKNSEDDKWRKFELISHAVFYDDLVYGFGKNQRSIEEWLDEDLEEGMLDESVEEILEQYQVDDYIEIIGTIHHLDTSHDTDCGWEYEWVEWLENIKHAKVGEETKQRLEWESEQMKKEDK